MDEQSAARVTFLPDARTREARGRTGRVRTCLPAQVARNGGERWRFPAEDEGAVVRGAD